MAIEFQGVECELKPRSTSGGNKDAGYREMVGSLNESNRTVFGEPGQNLLSSVIPHDNESVFK